MPRRWGGLELGFKGVIDVLTAMAGACMSTAWCAALYAEHPWILAHFGERAQMDVWRDGLDVPVCMSVAALGTATFLPAVWREPGSGTGGGGRGGAEGALEQFRGRASQRVLRYQNRVQANAPSS